jgi:hypothetical protein
MKHLLYLVCLLIATTGATAQDSTVALRQMPRVIIKFAPLSLLDQDATVQGGLEYRTGIRTSVQGEFGYGRKNLSLVDSDLNDFVSAEVWRGRAEVRFYTGRYRTNRRKDIAIRSAFPLGNYWAIEGLYKQINVVDQANVYSAEASSATGGYVLIGSQRIPISRYVFGAHLKVGRQFAFYDPYRRVFSRTLLDIYIGAGIRIARNDVSPRPFNPFPTCGCGIGRSLTSEGTAITPSLTAGLKLGFAL